MGKILNNPSSFLSTIQIGITLVGFFASAFAADYFADYFIKIININFLSDTVLRGLLVFVITLILSYFTLVFGELVPKKLAINNSFEIASCSILCLLIIALLSCIGRLIIIFHGIPTCLKQPHISSNKFFAYSLGNIEK